MLPRRRQQLDFLESELDADVVGGAGLAEADAETVELLTLLLACDGEPLVYCATCWQREFGESVEAPTG